MKARNACSLIGAALVSLNLCAATALAAPGGPASSAPVTLTCDVSDPTESVLAEPATIKLDEQAHTIEIHVPAERALIGPAPRLHVSQYTIGPTTATFTTDMITFNGKGSVGGDNDCYVLNRVTGRFFHLHDCGYDIKYFWSRLTCKVAQRQF